MALVGAFALILLLPLLEVVFASLLVSDSLSSSVAAVATIQLHQAFPYLMFLQQVAFFFAWQ